MITALLDLMCACFQAGNPGQMATIARSILASIPEDIVALHFLGLALYQMGHRGRAARVRQACARPAKAQGDGATTGEAAATTLREARTSAAGLGEAWQHRPGHARTRPATRPGCRTRWRAPGRHQYARREACLSACDDHHRRAGQVCQLTASFETTSPRHAEQRNQA
jgi:hypothetical protein